MALKLSAFVQCLPLWQGFGVQCGRAHLLKMHATYEESTSFQIPDFECEVWNSSEEEDAGQNFQMRGLKFGSKIYPSPKEMLSWAAPCEVNEELWLYLPVN